MSDGNSNKTNGRRNLLKGIAMGSGAVLAGKTLPDSWSRPVVDSVMLPAHAQTSFVGRSFTNVRRGTAIEPESKFAKALAGLVNDAHAQLMLFERSCIRENEDGTVQVDGVIDFGRIQASLVSASSVPVNGTPYPMSETPCLSMMPPAASLVDTLGLIPDAHAGTMIGGVQVVVDSINGNAVGRYILNLDGPVDLPFNLPVGDCIPPGCPVPI
ncbi:MAG: hypothetical protein ACN4GR_07990 [Arenicellales bacterium]